MSAPGSKKNGKKNVDDRYEIRLSGSGGQGLILAGVILATAIGVGDGKNAVQSQSYGPEARGGASRADVVVSSGEIYYPKTMKLDMLLALTQEACDKYYPDMKEGGILIVDSNLVTQVPTKNYHGFPFVRLAREEIGHAMVANVIALGAIAELTGIVSKASLKEAVLARAPRGTEDKNKKALELGFSIAKKAKGARS
ncbi:MAG: 2-oxoacid:ferredoxin oxidoreductase subunit gamma [Candidatus Zixiibacteriota bacterium]|nr:MAG: 2-oxoacid:ferredoxin oxidoreductase subunit gamma [candidate division Zixibacteria bacterium]HDL04457.1 2-oxoacid:ferredoxin oxidoreductase subunit gamma [candidate division Zixibacteria bacterium]